MRGTPILSAICPNHNQAHNGGGSSHRMAAQWDLVTIGSISRRAEKPITLFRRKISRRNPPIA
jgi:hypothetical protein